MAVTLASSSLTNWAAGTSVTITKPSGLAAGDLLICHYGIVDATDTISTLSGWTHAVNNNSAGGNIKTGVQWKIADSSDAAASNFTFSSTGTSNNFGALFRITGFESSDLLNIVGSSLQANSNTPTFNNSVTPITSDCLLLFLMAANDIGGTGSVKTSNQAIATSNPSWTELYDEVTGGSSTDDLISAAWASRSEGTATGNSSCSVGVDGATDSFAMMIAIGSISPVVKTISTGTWQGKSNGDNYDATPPSGLAVGDLVVAHVAGASPTNVGSFNITTSDTGWTSLGTVVAGASGNAAMKVFYKIADADDLTNLNNEFRFSNATGSSWLMAVQLYRISNYGGAPIIAFDGDDTADSTPTFTNTITPLAEYSLLLFLVNANDNQNSGSVSGYSITTSNPTWTEAYDSYGDGTSFFGAGDGDGLVAGAYAIRPEITATGDSTCTLATFANRSVGALVSIAGHRNVNASPSVISATLSTIAPTVTGDANMTTNVLSVSSSIQAPTVTTEASDWSNLPKSTTISPTNLPKS